MAGEPSGGHEGTVAASDLPSRHALETPATLALDVGLGRRVMIVGNVAPVDGPPGSRDAVGELVSAVDGWEGPGTVVLVGDVPQLAPPDADGPVATTASGAAGELTRSLRRFAGEADRRVLWIPAGSSPAVADEARRAAVRGLGVEVTGDVDLHMETAAGVRVVRVTADTAAAVPPDAPPASPAAPATPLPAATPTAHGTHIVPVVPDPTAPWQRGIDRLANPTAMPRFLTSRVLYRRMARFVWWLLLPFAVALLLRVAFVAAAADHLFFGRPAPMHAIDRARAAGWVPRLVVAGLVSAVELLVLVVVLAWLARKAWRTIGGESARRPVTDPLATAATPNEAARDRARALVRIGYSGVVTGESLQSELVSIGPGFFASAGTVGDVVEEHGARWGMPPVFLHRRQTAWVELEAGADLHARLLLASSSVPGATLLERLVLSDEPPSTSHVAMVAAFPMGASWPPRPDPHAVGLRSRRVRRTAAAAIAVAGVVDLLAALTPPLRDRLHLVLHVVPLGVAQAAGAIVGLAGLGLLALARGVRRGQRRAWGVAVALLAVTLVSHLVHGGGFEESVLTALVLGFLLVYRAEFRASADRSSLRSAVVALVAGVVAITVTATALVELTLSLDHDRRAPLPLWEAAEAVVSRMVGLSAVTLPDRLDDFLSPSLLAMGFALAAVAVVLATRPVVDRARAAGHAGAGPSAEARARDIVRRHGEDTLDYFALRSDKRWFFHHDTLIAYAIYGGVCVVSPDPIGPPTEYDAAWAAFRRFTDDRGWVVAVTGASADWLPRYRATGMHDIYIGDEAIVDVPNFSLAGGHMKGLRQAYNRVAKYGYRASFHDPASLSRELAASLADLMSQHPRGEYERGFSMQLGRVFDRRDEGLLLCVVTGPDDVPAAICQFVPARGIGGFSLDLMRRDRGEHPNGLIDFALVSTIGHLKEGGYRGLSLNFAALRSILEGERGDGVTQRVERWAVRKMSGFLQIETLWRFNAKYQPEWLSRYVMYDTPEHLVPVALALMRAESLSEVPVIGRVIAASGRRERGDASPPTTDAGSAHGPDDTRHAPVVVSPGGRPLPADGGGEGS